MLDSPHCILNELPQHGPGLGVGATRFGAQKLQPSVDTKLARLFEVHRQAHKRRASTLPVTQAPDWLLPWSGATNLSLEP